MINKCESFGHNLKPLITSLMMAGICVPGMSASIDHLAQLILARNVCLEAEIDNPTTSCKITVAC